MKRFLHGLHEPGGEWLMGDFPGWIVFTHKLGDDPTHDSGCDYRQWSDAGFHIIARLNYGYGSEGTIPVPGRYARFAARCARFVEHSQGCSIWVVGNEPNHPQERPNGMPIVPQSYADCYAKVWRAIKGLATRELQQVVPAPIAPWNNQTVYLGNAQGDWIWYFVDVLQLIMERDAMPDAIALHTYTHGHNPALITDESTMNPPFQHRRYNFRTYIDFLDAIPVEMSKLPVYITEMDANDPWSDVDNGWILGAYREINRSNESGAQPILAGILYRWPRIDKWFMDGKTKLYRDFRNAVQQRFTWEDKEPEVATCFSVKKVATSSATVVSGLQFCSRDQDKFFELELGDERLADLAEWLNGLGLVQKKE